MEHKRFGDAPGWTLKSVKPVRVVAPGSRYNPQPLKSVTEKVMSVTSSANQPPPDWDSATVVDARNLPCPQPLLAMRRALREHPEGTLLCVLATDEGSWRDFHSFATLSGWALLRAERRNNTFQYWLYAGT
ncbi:sulfurtransferase TusA family protein [Microbulbifer sp. OS29]|uniref:Sulfurtransferase TusA family protein n=1 Tax=Microbulbifer okhotskensis TaxID=2926617 RepID=A0A9X2ERF6_9GAMM|nr:sulfurtransferase TusA family protein [Microbulbifer okhotskensis]MCO1336461.1 sulfurtransferase TusA family protein [Microbulbifer okhotskensis]